MSTIKSTFKSDDTEEWLDTVWTRPIGYVITRLCAALGIHPNTVTIASMIIGAVSGLLFAHGSFYYEGERGLWLNVAGVMILALANFLDSADGQLARLTGKKTQLGRILDGIASGVWFAPIYVAIIWRFFTHHTVSFTALGIADTMVNAAIGAFIVFVLAAYSGFGCHAAQCRLADYYRQIHLFFLKGEAGSELHNSRQQQALLEAMTADTPWIERHFQRTYANYTRQQERSTPQFQHLVARLTELYGSPSAAPSAFMAEFRRRSLPLMKFTNILTFNTRAIVLYLTALADCPIAFLLFEIVVMNMLKWYMHSRHENMCRQLCESL